MEYTVRPEEAGRRLREILRGSAGLSYTALKSAKWHGSIRAEGRPVHVDYRPEAGERILEVSSLEGAMEKGLLTLSITDKNGQQTIRLLLRGGEAHP